MNVSDYTTSSSGSSKLGSFSSTAPFLNSVSTSEFRSLPDQVNLPPCPPFFGDKLFMPVVFFRSFLSTSMTLVWVLCAFLGTSSSIFSTYISDFFSYYINRQFMFILCNVILVFVTQGYGLNIGRSASMAATDDLHDEFDMKNRDYRRPTLDIVEMQVSVGDEEGMAESVETLVPVEKEEEDGYDGGDENEMVTWESAESVGTLVPVEKEEEDGYDDNEMVTGESDERFDDFIKKMKEKMRTEALQLVLVDWSIVMQEER